MNASCIKAIKSTYEACKEAKTVPRKGMNEFLEAEKEAGAYEEAGRVVETTEENSVRKSPQALAKRAYPSPSTNGSCRKKAQMEPKTEVPLQGASQLGLGSVESKEEE